MEDYYAIEMNKNETWSITLNGRKAIGEFEHAELANDIAEALNEAFQEGKRFAEDRIKDKLSKFISE